MGNRRGGILGEALANALPVEARPGRVRSSLGMRSLDLQYLHVIERTCFSASSGAPQFGQLKGTGGWGLVLRAPKK